MNDGDGTRFERLVPPTLASARFLIAKSESSRFDLRWLLFAMLMTSFYGSFAAEQNKPILTNRGVTHSLTNSLTVSHGHAYVVAGQPGFLYGGVQDDAGKWKLNYLILVKHHATAKSSVDHRDPEPTVSSDSSDGVERRLNFKQRLRIDDVTLDYSYRSRIDLATNVLSNEQFTVQGKPMQVKRGRIFMIDMTVAPIHCQQVNVDLPTSEIDFVNGQPNQIEEMTKQWMSDLINSSEIVAKTFKP